VSGTAPFAPSAAGVRFSAGAGTSSVVMRQGGAGIVSTSIDTGVGSATLAATAVSARVVLPDLGVARTALP